MESSTSSISNIPWTRTPSNGKTPRPGEKIMDDKSIFVKSTPQPGHRGTPYKEKYHAMQERFNQVSATRETARRELAIAEEKLKRLQEECNLLLDAVDIAVPAQPTLLHYLSQDPIPPQYHSYQVPFPAAPGAPAAPPDPTPAPGTRSRRKSAHQTIGNGVSRK
ncbi:uncharacterized protein LAESUDRAFT_117383 [Laetiporus sulphureus 93-53]|uniref:Uncharacterized protein n=1 Tax=Laetiporus sulphureus 93-53 TaxID=1314785 RepID=A0A165EJC9_9APHY|nr:uncharacterized protein LAESUDRAFT_117383 [Laetiporus sulphureus 93-53]KZT07171.1 hypothetical protein LAESUDRAFT_117383 [Laetiporus sulphureus 93-53]